MTAATVTTPIPPGSPVGGAAVSPSVVTIAGSSDFSAAVLAQVAAITGQPIPITGTNVAALNAWQAAEGQWHAGGSWNAAADHNPLNLEGNTKGHPNPATSVQYATPPSGNPINVYADWTTGIQETALRIAANPGIVAVLRADAGTAALSAAVSQSGWGTGNFAGGSGANQTGSSTGTATLTGALGIPALPGTLLNPTGGLGSLNPLSWTDALGTVLNDVLHPASWGKRVAMVIGGAALVVGGLSLFVASTQGDSIEKALPLAAAVAA